MLSDSPVSKPQFWLRLLLVFAVLVLSVGLPALAGRQQLSWGLVLLLGAGLIVICLRWPPVGLIAAALAGMVVPYVGPSGLNVTMVLVALLLGLWLADMLARKRQLRLAPSLPVWPLLALCAIALISFSVGQLNWFTFAVHAPLGAQLGGLSIIWLSAGTFLLVANQVNDLAWLQRLTWAILALGAISILVRSVLPQLGLPAPTWFHSAGSLFYVWLVAIAFSQAAFNRDLSPGWRLALAGLVLVNLYVLLGLKFADKSGWVPPVVAIVTIIGARSWRAGLVLVLLAGVMGLFLEPTLLGSDQYSLTTRLEAWSILAQIVKASPIWGLGFGNYYWYTPLFPIRGYAVSFNSHNNYVDIVAQTGLAGLGCFLLFLLAAGWLGWRLRERVPAGFAQAYVYGALGGLAGTAVAGMLGDWVLPFFYNIGLNGFRSSMLGWLFLGGLVSLEHMTFGRKASE